MNVDLVALVIAQNSREIDTTGDYILSISQIAKLIDDFGKQEYNRGYRSGEITQMRYPRGSSEMGG